MRNIIVKYIAGLWAFTLLRWRPRRYVAVWLDGLSFRSQAFQRREHAHEWAMAHAPSAVINPGGAVDLDLWE